MHRIFAQHLQRLSAAGGGLYIEAPFFMLSGDKAPETAAVDPGDPEPVMRHLEKTGRRLTAILNTHHHSDHTGGNRALLERFPDIPVYGGAGDRGRRSDAGRSPCVGLFAHRFICKLLLFSRQ